MSMRRTLALKLAILVSVSLLAVGSQVLAQSDEIPDSVLVTGPLIFSPRASEDPPSPMNERLTQLTDDEIKAILPGATIRPISRLYLISLSINCGGSYEFLNATPVSPPYPSSSNAIPLYSVGGNQVCLPVQDWCFKIFRSEAGTMFSDVYERGHAGLRLVEIVPPPERACQRR
jgi:hypothetical protein